MISHYWISQLPIKRRSKGIQKSAGNETFGGISLKRKTNVINKLRLIFPSSALEFWEELPVAGTVPKINPN